MRWSLRILGLVVISKVLFGHDDCTVLVMDADLLVLEARSTTQGCPIWHQALIQCHGTDARRFGHGIIMHSSKARAESDAMTGHSQWQIVQLSSRSPAQSATR